MITKILTSFILCIGIIGYAQESTTMNKISNYTKNELALINQKPNDSKFRVLLTTDELDYKVLRAKNTDLNPTDPATKKLADRMLATVLDKDSRGVGIAAPQIGINRNAFWIQRFDKQNEPFEFFINPTITWYSDIKRKGREGCLSIPDITGNVIRSLAVRIEYYDLEGQFHDEVIEGFTAVIAQHEFDHLIATLFPDRLKEQDAKLFDEAQKQNELLYEKKVSE